MSFRVEKSIARLLAVMALLACVQPVCAEAPTRFQSETPAPRVDYWQKREAEITSHINSSKDLSDIKLVFIGDSITDFWHFDENPWFKGKWMGKTVWDESFGPGAGNNRALNIGISGDRIEHVLYRLTPAAQGGMGMLDRSDLNPEFLLIMLGINNTFDGEEPLADSLFQGVKTAVDVAHKVKPGAKIILQSILPTDDQAKNKTVVAEVNNRLIRLSKLQKYSGFVKFLDLYPGFVDSAGTQRKSLFVDGLHPNREGYRVWRDLLIEQLGSARAER